MSIKKFLMLGVLTLLISAWFNPGAATAATGPELMLKGVEHYEFAEFEQAGKVLRQALAKGDLSPSLQARAHAYLGLVSMAQGNESAAVTEFKAAKQAYPQFKPDPRRFPPKAVALYEKATGAPAPKPKPKKAKPSPKKVEPVHVKTKGYVVDVSGDEVVLDLGSKYQVKIGERFEIYKVKTLVHPVTKKKLHKKTTLGTVQVVDVQKELSTAKILTRSGKIAPGQQAAKLPKNGKVAEKPSAKPAKAASSNGRISGVVAIMPPVGSYLDVPSGVTARGASRALASVKGFHLKTKVVSAGSSKSLQRRYKFDLEDFLIAPGVSMRGVKGLFTQSNGIKNFLNVKLAAKEVRLLTSVMKRLGVDHLLVWGFRAGVDEDFVQIVATLFRRGQDRPVLVEAGDMWKARIPDEYRTELAKILKDGLAKKKK